MGRGGVGGGVGGVGQSAVHGSAVSVGSAGVSDGMTFVGGGSGGATVVRGGSGTVEAVGGGGGVVGVEGADGIRVRFRDAGLQQIIARMVLEALKRQLFLLDAQVINKNTYVHTYMQTCMRTCMHVHACIHECIHACMHIFRSIHMKKASACA